MKNWIGRISLALSNVEKNATSQTGEQLSSDISHVQKHTQGQIADSLINGEITQEVMDLRWRTYKVLNETNNYSSKIVGYEPDGTPIVKTSSKDFKKGLNRIKLDSYDSFPLEMVVSNDDIVIGGNEAMDNEYIILLDKAEINYDDDGNLISATHGEIGSDEYFTTTKGEKPIFISSENTRQFRIEQYTKKLHVRKISDTERLLEFYVSKHPDEYNRSSRFFLSDLKKAIETPEKANMLEINSVLFITDKTIGKPDCLEFQYEITSFDKIIEFNGNYVIKFKANVVVDGENILSKYKQDELENKYKNKVRK